MHPALIACLQSPPQAQPAHDVADWWAHWLSLSPQAADPVALALHGGFAADRVGWAFASGYQAALRALVPGLAHDSLTAFCVTEATGNRPRDIATTFTPQADGSLLINGHKRWTTLGPAGTVLLVVGALAEGEPAARSALRVARVPVPTPGLVLQPMPPTAFVPEVPHAQVLLQGVQVPAGALLPGDGHDGYVKPFRTLEDLHVTLAVLACLLREARARTWPPALAEQVLATMLLLCALAGEDLQAASTHIALAGALHAAHHLVADAQPLWAAAAPDDAAAQRWLRDAPLLGVAGTARQLRAQGAWQRLIPRPSFPSH